jgi:hypothetical protein
MKPSKSNPAPLMSFVTVQGEFGSDEIFVFPNSELSEEQWEFLDELSETDRFPFVVATVKNDHDTLRDLFEEYQGYLEESVARLAFPVLFR